MNQDYAASGGAGGWSSRIRPKQGKILSKEPQLPAVCSAPEPLGGPSSSLHTLPPSHGPCRDCSYRLWVMCLLCYQTPQAWASLNIAADLGSCGSESLPGCDPAVAGAKVSSEGWTRAGPASTQRPAGAQSTAPHRPSDLGSALSVQVKGNSCPLGTSYQRGHCMSPAAFCFLGPRCSRGRPTHGMNVSKWEHGHH